MRSPTGIAADPPLTSHGTRQADEMASHLATLPIDAVYSSPYYRCLQTINPYATLAAGGSATGATGGKIRAEPGIAEWFGSAPFDHPRPADTAVLADMFPLLDTGYTPSRVPSSKGETLAELYARVGQAAEAIVRRSEEEGHKTVVLCTHAAVVIVLGRVLTGQIPESADNADFEAYTCGLSTYERTGEEGTCIPFQPRCPGVMRRVCANVDGQPLEAGSARSTQTAAFSPAELRGDGKDTLFLVGIGMAYSNTDQRPTGTFPEMSPSQGQGPCLRRARPNCDGYKAGSLPRRTRTTSDTFSEPTANGPKKASADGGE